VKLGPGKVDPVKAAPPKNISVIKVIRPKAKPRPKGMSEIEMIQVKPIGVSKKLCLSDVPGSSQSHRDEGPHAI
jgi:hypothetical protein